MHILQARGALFVWQKGGSAGARHTRFVILGARVISGDLHHNAFKLLCSWVHQSLEQSMPCEIL